MSKSKEKRKLQKIEDGESPFPIKYYCVRPNRWTFQNDKIRNWTLKFVDGFCLNACCGKTKLSESGILRNDLNPEIDADLHIDVTEINEYFGNDKIFDSVIFDPPYSEYKAESIYSGFRVQDVSDALRAFDKILKPGGCIIGFGFTTTLTPGKWGYEREEVAIFNTFGRQNDWLGTVDRKPMEQKQ